VNVAGSITAATGVNVADLKGFVNSVDQVTETEDIQRNWHIETVNENISMSKAAT